MRNGIKMHLDLSPSLFLADYAGFLQVNSETYEELVHKTSTMGPQNEAEAVLDQVALAARFAVQFHPGRFVDGAIENLALEIGAQLRNITADESGIALPLAPKKGDRRRILHVATSVMGIGGHTRMLNNWVQSDKGSCHWLILTNQGDFPIPEWLSEAVRSTGGDLVVLPKGSGLCQKAKWLRGTARRVADLVVLHHGSFDVLPTVAFAVDGCPPVALLNHADHEFWLGGSVSDIVINLRTVGSEHTCMRRFISTNTVIPIPLPHMQKGMARSNARTALGIPQDQIVLLSVSRPIKYRPCGPYDFVATAGKILDRNPEAHLYVVGESSAGIAPYLRCGLHERLHFVGSIEDPSLYRIAADAYLESFPFGAQTALLEAAVSGLPVAPAYAPLFPLLVANDDAVKHLIPNPKNEQEYIEGVEQLIRQPELRNELGSKLRECLLLDHVGVGWQHRLTDLYRQTDFLSHRPKHLPTSQCKSDDADIGLSLWHAMANGNNYFMDTSADIASAVLCHTAFLAKDTGDYARARRFIIRALRLDPYHWASWRLLLISLIGRWGKLLRQALPRA